MFDLVVTTPSTIIQDALCAGTVPVLVDLADVDADSVYGCYPYRASQTNQLVDVVRRVKLDRSRAFQRA